MSEPEIEVKDDSLNPDDKTSKNEIKEEIDNLPDEDGEEEEKKDTEEKPKDDVDRSEVAQKIRWREKYRKERELRRAEAEARANAPASKPVEGPEGDEKDAAARRYISDIVKQHLSEREKEREDQKQRELDEFSDKLDEALDDNPSLKEDELLEVIDDYKVEPAVAVKILLRFKKEAKAVSKEKPKMPISRRASPSTPTEKPDDKGKSMYQIAQEVIKGITGK